MKLPEFEVFQPDFPLIESVNVGFGGEDVEQIAMRINLPYVYLSRETRGNIKNIVYKSIIPRLQDALRRGEQSTIFAEQIAFYRQTFLPEQLSVLEFLLAIRKTYAEKINLQALMAKFLTEQSNSTGRYFPDGIKLYQQSLVLEPIFFALGSRVKDYIGYCAAHLSYLSSEETQLLLTPSSPPVYTKFWVEFSEYQLSHGREDEKPLKERLLNLYFNSEPEYFDAFQKEQQSRGRTALLQNSNERQRLVQEITRLKDQFQMQTLRKRYFLMERKIRYAKEVDELLVIDNCFEKYFEMKLCFLHDLFLKMWLMAVLRDEFLDFRLADIDEQIERAIFYPDAQLLADSSKRAYKNLTP